MTLASLHRPLKLAALTSALVFAFASQAAVPSPTSQRVLHAVPEGAGGYYDLDDGRELRLRVRSDGMVVSIGSQRADLWQPAGEGVFVSPDGKQRLRLYRGSSGTVDRLELETRVAR